MLLDDIVEGWNRVTNNSKPLAAVVALLLIPVCGVSLVGGDMLGYSLAFFLSPLLISAVFAILTNKASSAKEAVLVGARRYLSVLLTQVFVAVIVALLFFVSVFLAAPLSLFSGALVGRTGMLVIYSAILVVVLFYLDLKFLPALYFAFSKGKIVEAIRCSLKVPVLRSLLVMLELWVPFVAFLFFLFLPMYLLDVLSAHSYDTASVVLELYALCLAVPTVLWMAGIYVTAFEKESKRLGERI